MSEEPSCSIVIICGTRRLHDGKQETAVFISGVRSLRISIIIVHLICITLCDGVTSSSCIDCVWTATTASSYSFMTCENINTPPVSLYHFLWLFLDTHPSIVYPIYPSCEHSRQIFRVYHFFHCWIWIHLHCVMILNLCYTSYKEQYCCLVLSGTHFALVRGLTPVTCRYSRLWKWSLWSCLSVEKCYYCQITQGNCRKCPCSDGYDSKSLWFVWLLVCKCW